jgi:hypothetical protein
MCRKNIEVHVKRFLNSSLITISILQKIQQRTILDIFCRTLGIDIIFYKSKPVSQ